MHERDDINDRRRRQRKRQRRRRYATLDLDGRGTVIYDRDNPNAWIQSDAAAPLETTV